MIQDHIHQQICKKHKELSLWFEDNFSQYKYPIYTSFDIRDSGEKIAPVDANIFPAGFNNICEVDRGTAVTLFSDYVEANYNATKNILLLTEEHTNNLFYLENVATIKEIAEQAGYTVVLGIPSNVESDMHLETSTGKKITLNPWALKGEGGEDLLYVGDTKIDLVVCNNDFTKKTDIWLENIKTPITPSLKLGWYRRKKSDFFSNYNNLAEKFSEIIDINPELIKITTEKHEGFEVGSEESAKKLASHCDDVLKKLATKYKELGIDTTPYLFVKNNSGTYGLGVTKVESAEEVLAWNYKTRKKMKAVKGGGSISEVIVQEGIPTYITSEDLTAEPTIYLIGNKLAGGFLRAHSKKGALDSLNSPGAVYKRLCVTDLSVNVSGCPMENVYGWLARLSLIAVAQEAL